MNQDTPAISIKEKDLKKNCLALRELLEHLRGEKIRSVVDIRYGLGGWAVAVAETFRCVKILGYEQDEPTFQNAFRPSYVTIKKERYEGQPIAADLLLADFNTLTKLKRELLDEALNSARVRYAIFTDVACCKLHLNFASYGLKTADLEAYWRSFLVEGYELVAFAKQHHAASSALFKRKTQAG